MSLHILDLGLQQGIYLETESKISTIITPWCVIDCPNVLGFIIFPPDIFVVFWLFAHKWNLGSLLSLLGAYHGL